MKEKKNIEGLFSWTIYIKSATTEEKLKNES